MGEPNPMGPIDDKTADELMAPINTQASEANPEPIKVEQPKQIWLIEDSGQLAKLIVEGGSSILGQNQVNATIVHFQEGEQAIARYEEILEKDELPPVIILMDYSLEGEVENPKYKTGVAVIEELKQVAARHNAKLPQIVAFSTEEEYAAELMKAGASSSVDKRKGTLAYFKSLRLEND
ncbi:MAG: hypothetical protein ABH810_02665 [bacterium]